MDRTFEAGGSAGSAPRGGGVLAAILMAAAAAALALAAVPARAQPAGPGPGPGVAETARQATPAQGDSEAASLQAYVLMLQQAEEELRRAKEAAAKESASYSGGAMTPARQELMQKTRAAWRAMQQVPPTVEQTEAYRSAEREVRQAFGEIGPTRTLSREEGDRAAESALRAMDRLRAQVAERAAAQGAPVPAPPLATGAQGSAPAQPATGGGGATAR
jgi:hypothetical protein